MHTILILLQGITLTILPSITPVEASIADLVNSGWAGAMEEASLVVSMSVSLIHVLLLDLDTLPQGFVLYPLDLGENKIMLSGLLKIVDLVEFRTLLVVHKAKKQRITKTVAKAIRSQFRK